MDIGSLINELAEIKQVKNKKLIELEELTQQQQTMEKQIKSKLESSDEFNNLSEDEFQLLMSELVNSDIINVEVVYALPNQQTLKEIQIKRGSTIEDCIITSSILTEYNDIDLSQNRVGIHGSIKPLTEVVHDGDRVEIYRKINAKV